MSNVLFPGFEFGGAEGAAIVVEGAEVLEVDLEEVIALADLATGDASPIARQLAVYPTSAPLCS